MSELSEIMEAASRLPLYDAAYELWKRKSRLDRLQSTSPPTKPRPANLRDPDALRRMVQDVVAKLHHERVTAQDGATFDRLKQAHPEASDEDLKRAIKAAVKLDSDCTKYFSHSNEGFSSDISRAIKLAKKANPGFREQTYSSAAFHLTFVMK